jgi:putative transposase
MARKLRLEYEGAIYHVMNRGNGRAAVFRTREDRTLFLETLEEACAKTDWQIHAYCLMRTHFHLVLETPRANLVAGMKWLMGTYTNRFNRRHKVFGHLFSGRYKALIVDGSGNGYLRTVCDYVHLNPARAHLMKAEQKLSEFPWSSYAEYLKAPKARPSWLRVDRVLGECGIPKDSPAGREQFAARTEARRGANEDEFKKLKRGWYFGDKEFREELLSQMHEKRGAEHFGEEVRESAEVQAERLVRQELKKLGWQEKELSLRRKGDVAKLRIAKLLREKTTMTLSWIAERLQMGTKTHLAHLLYWAGRVKPKRKK